MTTKTTNKTTNKTTTKTNTMTDTNPKTAPKTTPKTTMTGAHILIKALKEQGVEVVFGYPGGAVLPIYDVIFQQNDIRHVLVRHEQGAVHAAEGYARSTGKPGVVLVTSGPGATNAVTGPDRCPDGFDSSGCYQRASADFYDWRGRVSRGRYGGHNPPLHET